MIGQTISHYRILEKLGGGGMGVVYKARRHRACTVSSLSSFFPTMWLAIRKLWPAFEREAQAASALNHPNICTIHDIGKQDRAGVHRHGVP